MIIKHGRHMFEKFTRCTKVCGLLFLDCAFRTLTNNDHVEGGNKDPGCISNNWALLCEGIHTLIKCSPHGQTHQPTKEKIGKVGRGKKGR